jgi:hypothetical protein
MRSRRLEVQSLKGEQSEPTALAARPKTRRLWPCARGTVLQGSARLTSWAAPLTPLNA